MSAGKFKNTTVTVTAITALVIGGAAYHFRSEIFQSPVDPIKSTSSKLVVAFSDSSDRPVNFKLGGQSFSIPRSQLHSSFEPNPSKRDETWGEFGMVGLGTSFDKKTPANLQKFSAIPSESDVVHVSVALYCPSPPAPSSADLCSSPGGMEQQYSIHALRKPLFGSFIAAGTGAQRPDHIPTIPGLVYQGYTVIPADKGQSEPKTLVYSTPNRTTTSGFGVCTRRENQRGYQCTLWQPWRGNSYLRYRFREELLSGWPTIQATVRERIKSYTTT